MIKDKNDVILGAILRKDQSNKKPIYVSPGHLIDTQEAIKITKEFSKFRIPEPIR